MTSDQGHRIERKWAPSRVSAAALGIRLLLLLLCSVGLGATRSYAQCEYQVTLIQPRPCPISGVPLTWPSGVSSAAHVVGWYQDCDSDDVAYLWTSGLGVFDIPVPPGTVQPRCIDVNSQGVVIGRYCLPGDDGGFVGFVYENGKITNMETLPGANYTEPSAVNNLGQIVGAGWNSVTDDPPLTPFFWQDGVMTSLAVSFGPHGRARDINDNGQVVGWMGLAEHIDSHAFMWETGDLTDLGSAPGAFASDASAIDNSGRVVIVGKYQEDKSSPVLVRSFLWDEGQWIEIGPLPGFDRCAARDMNDAGQVLGTCSKSDQPGLIVPFLWQEGVISALEDLIPDPAANPSTPFAINESGQIVVRGAYDAENAALLLTPINPPPADVNYDCTVDRRDLLLLLESWGPCPEPPLNCLADVNDDGNVDVRDLLTMLSGWSF